MMKVLVVTGGIGSGKSLVCRMLAEKGIPVYEADKRAKLLYVEVPSMLDDIETSLGVRLRDSNGDFVPAMLAEVIFRDKDALKKVEDILFPVMKKDFARWSDAQGKEVTAFESATVLEKPQFDGFGDIVLLVDAPVEVRRSRAMQRDGVSEEVIQRRINAQPIMNRLSQGETDPRIDHVLLNDSTEEELERKLDEFIEKYELTKML